jgi:DNA-binding response OmpR family regulator
LAILDVMVPGRDGFQLLEALRPYGIPALFLTARDDISSKLKGLTGGAEDYMVKPFEVLELLVRVDKILARASRGEPILRVLDLEISQEEHRVRKAGKEVPLKPMEFALLVALAKNKNIAVSREDLIGLVWGSGYLGETRTVDVHIGQLRKKLGLHEAIKTIPKLGYRLEEP